MKMVWRKQKHFNTSTIYLFLLITMVTLVLFCVNSCEGIPRADPQSAKSVATSLLRRRNNKSKSSSSSSSSSSLICSLPPVTPGTPACFASFRRWTYSLEKRNCEQIYYGGCFGTKNLFESYEDCKKTCGGVGR